MNWTMPTLLKVKIKNSLIDVKNKIMTEGFLLWNLRINYPGIATQSSWHKFLRGNKTTTFGCFRRENSKLSNTSKKQFNPGPPVEHYNVIKLRFRIAIF